MIAGTPVMAWYQGGDSVQPAVGDGELQPPPVYDFPVTQNKDIGKTSIILPPIESGVPQPTTVRDIEHQGKRLQVVFIIPFISYSTIISMCLPKGIIYNHI